MIGHCGGGNKVVCVRQRTPHNLETRSQVECDVCVHFLILVGNCVLGFSVFIDAQGGSVCNMVCPFRARLMTLLQAVITASTAGDALLRKTAKRSSNHLMSELVIPQQRLDG